MTTTTKKAEVHPMVAEYNALKVERMNATRGKGTGKSAAITRKMNTLALDMTIAGIPFDEYKPVTATNGARQTDDDIRARIADLQKVQANAKVSDSIRHLADKEITRLDTLLANRAADAAETAEETADATA